MPYVASRLSWFSGGLDALNDPLTHTNGSRLPDVGVPPLNLVNSVVPLLMKRFETFEPGAWPRLLPRTTRPALSWRVRSPRLSRAPPEPALTVMNDTPPLSVTEPAVSL